MSAGTAPIIRSETRPLHLGVFFSYRVGLSHWEKLGTLSREIRIYEDLTKRGIRVRLYTWDSPADLPRYRKAYPAMEILSWRERGSKRMTDAWRSIVSVFQFRESLAQLDVIKSYQLMGSWQAVLAKGIHRKAYFLRAGYDLYEFHLQKHSSFFKRTLVYLVCWVAFRSADAILVTTARMKSFALKHYRPRAPIRIGSNFVDERAFVPGERAPERDAIYVGRLDPHKNLDRVIELCAEMKWSLTVVGEGPLQKELELKARTLAVDALFPGKIPNELLPQVLARHRYFTLLSKSEGSPKAMLEGMSCGLIPIGSAVPGIRELVNEVDPSLLIESFTSEEYRRLKVHLADRSRLAESSKRSRQYVLDHCSLSSLIETEATLIEGIRK